MNYGFACVFKLNLDVINNNFPFLFDDAVGMM